MSKDLSTTGRNELLSIIESLQCENAELNEKLTAKQARLEELLDCCRRQWKHAELHIAIECARRVGPELDDWDAALEAYDCSGGLGEAFRNPDWTER